ncbi:hypothetical protein [Nocardia sp. NPDC003963]
MNELPEQDDHCAPFGMLTAHAETRGYRLVRESGTAAGWALLDATDGETLYAATTLIDIAQYLDE